MDRPGLSTNATVPSLPPGNFPPPPPGLQYLDVIRPSVEFLIVDLVWTTLLLPMLLALFIFSNARMRRTLIFRLNIASLIVVMFTGTLNAYLGRTTIICPSPEKATKVIGVMYTVIICLLPLFVESILVVRVVAVYPLRRIPKKAAWLIYAPLAAIKVGRLATFLAFLILFLPGVSNPLWGVTTAKEMWASPTAQVQWALAMLDNGYCSGLFLWKLRTELTNTSQFNTNSTTSTKRNGYMTTLRGLFWIAVSNFVFPFLLSLVQFICTQVNSLKDGRIGSHLAITNVNITAIGVVLATVWSGWHTEDTDGESAGKASSTTLPWAVAAGRPPTFVSRRPTGISTGIITEIRSQEENVFGLGHKSEGIDINTVTEEWGSGEVKAERV